MNELNVNDIILLANVPNLLKTQAKSFKKLSLGRIGP